ncbi:MAG: type II toxin-antitoxin system VapC family toxin [Solirubrobacteraceae bacterium]
MGIVVFDSDVLIGFLDADDGHHEAAVSIVRHALAPGTQRWVCAVNYAEVLIGPVRTGKRDLVDAMFVRFNIETKQVDMDLARRAAAVRAETNLKLPDAFALATVVHAEHRGHDDVHLASFDAKVAKAHLALHPQPQSGGMLN